LKCDAIYKDSLCPIPQVAASISTRGVHIRSPTTVVMRGPDVPPCSPPTLPPSVHPPFWWLLHPHMASGERVLKTVLRGKYEFTSKLNVMNNEFTF